MAKLLHVIQYFKQRIPQKYRLIAFLVVTSIIGVWLIILAVYNTSKDLEIIHEMDNLHRFAKASLAANNRVDALVQALTSQHTDDYQVLVWTTIVSIISLMIIYMPCFPLMSVVWNSLG